LIAGVIVLRGDYNKLFSRKDGIIPSRSGFRRFGTKGGLDASRRTCRGRDGWRVTSSIWTSGLDADVITRGEKDGKRGAAGVSRASQCGVFPRFDRAASYCQTRKKRRRQAVGIGQQRFPSVESRISTVAMKQLRSPNPSQLVLTASVMFGHGDDSEAAALSLRRRYTTGFEDLKRPADRLFSKHEPGIH